MNTQLRRLQRRRFLRNTGVFIALPGLEALRVEAAPAAGPTSSRACFVAINIPLGFHPDYFFPTGAGVDYPLSRYLQQASSLRNDFTVISGTSHPDVDGGHSAEKSFLTAAPHPGSRSFRNTISLDQLIAQQVGQQTRFASLTLGDQSLSWSANGVATPAISSPVTAFQRLFVRGSAHEVRQQQQRLDDGQSVLDLVLPEAHSLSRALGPADRQQLQQYFDAVRETEQNLIKQKQWLETPLPMVTEQAPPQHPTAAVTARLRGHLQVIALALETDSTRVATLGGNAGGEVPPLPGVDQGYHALSHHGMNPQMIQQLQVIEHETIRVWTEFVQRLKGTRDGAGTLLDRTQVLLGSNLGSASGHLTTNLPIILAGGPFRHGQHLAFDRQHNTPLPRLFVSCLQGMGLEYETFATGKGTLTGLEFQT